MMYIAKNKKFGFWSSPKTKDEVQKYGIDPDYRYYEFEEDKAVEVDLRLIIERKP